MHRAATQLTPLCLARRAWVLPCVAMLSWTALASLICVVPAMAGDGYVTYRAVIVGIADFEGTLNDLTYTDDDARDMQAALLASNNWSQDNIELLLDTAATKAAIQAAISSMLSSADDDDVVLLYYSSHGGQEATDLDPVDEPDSMDEYLVTTELATIRDDELGSWFAASPTRRTLIILDTCFSGGQIKDLPPGLSARTVNPNPAPPNMGNGITEDFAYAIAHRPGVDTRDLDDNGNCVVLTACDGDELSSESPELENGIFTEYVLQAIIDTGLSYPGDANANRWVSGEETYAYAAPRATAYNPSQNAQLFDADTTFQLEFVGVADTAPAPPRTISAFDTQGDEGGSVTVSWSKSRDDGRGQNDVTGYGVLRARSDAGPFTQLALLPKGSTIYEDATTTDGTDYYYKVQVRDATHTSESAIAGPVQSIDDLPPDAVANLYASDTVGDDGGSITLNWSGYAAPTDFQDYRVYRSEAAFTSIDEEGVQLLTTIAQVNSQVAVDDATVDGTEYWYAVTARDDIPNENKSVTSVGPVVSSPNFTFTYAPGLSLISVGADTQEEDLAAVLGVLPASLSAARWDPTTATYRTYQGNPNDPFMKHALGRAFWLRTSDPVMRSVAGQPAPAGDYPVSVVPGWNMIGNPYTAHVDVTGATVISGGETMTLAQAAARGWVRDYMWSYDTFLKSYVLVSPSVSWADKTIRKGCGVFIRSFVNAQVLLPRPASAAEPTGATAAGASAIAADWKVRLVAECSAGSDTDNFVGVSAAADALNAIASPPPQGVDLYFPAAEGVRAAAAFVDEAAPGMGRQFAVEASQAGPVTISWPDLTNMPTDLRPVLVDAANGKQVYMRTAAGYTFEAAQGVARNFRIELRAADEGALVVRTMNAVPAGAGAQIVFTLSKDATVRAQVMNVSGRVVRALSAGTQVTGGQAVTLSWDGRSAAGTKVPAGRYIVRLSAATEDGQTTSAVASLAIGR